jgi:hypothetical protein
MPEKAQNRPFVQSALPRQASPSGDCPEGAHVLLVLQYKFGPHEAVKEQAAPAAKLPTGVQTALVQARPARHW